jgi:hypothetical protein
MKHEFTQITKFEMNQIIDMNDDYGNQNLTGVPHSHGFTKKYCVSVIPIRALSAHLGAEFNILPGRWQHVWLVAIVPPKRWGKMD